ncbi:DUF4249 domain-containing protein [Tamlana flava]|uniref:DUF4249 domain-containing protein n=1 Tax=Tamlana flava TaxID=3158572 RepID=UPI00351BDAC5
MKSIFKVTLFFLLIFSCEDVINLDLKNSEPRLVIDASINWEKGTDGKFQTIKLSLTAPYFDTEIPPATGAIVTVTDLKNNAFSFVEEGNSGIYNNDSFIPEIGETYYLYVTYNNELYTATETLMPVVPIESVEQKNDGGFSGNEIELKAFYTDPKDIENFYLFEFDIVKFESTFFEVYEDKFTDGNRIFAFYSNEDIALDDEIKITNYGISKRAYEYYNILLQQTDENSGDPFETQPATLRGNCINQTNPDNFPLGYFKISETDVFTYLIE